MPSCLCFLQQCSQFSLGCSAKMKWIKKSLLNKQNTVLCTHRELNHVKWSKPDTERQATNILSWMWSGSRKFSSK